LLLARTLSLYEPNATRRRLNGAKTLDLWTRQGCKGQNTINYRPQGLAEEIPETQRIVLAKRTKIRVRYANCLGWDLCVEVESF
jgi:hypothetical protein